MSSHYSQADIAFGIWIWLSRHQGEALVGIEDDVVDLVESSKEILDVFR